MTGYNYTKLRKRIRRVCKTEREFARRIGICPGTLSEKLNGKTFFCLFDMEKAVDVLGIADGDISEYFFTKETLTVGE